MFPKRKLCIIVRKLCQVFFSLEIKYPLHIATKIVMRPGFIAAIYPLLPYPLKYLNLILMGTSNNPKNVTSVPYQARGKLRWESSRCDSKPSYFEGFWIPPGVYPMKIGAGMTSLEDTLYIESECIISIGSLRFLEHASVAYW